MSKDFQQIEPNRQLEDDFRQIVRLAVREDFEDQVDWTTVSLVESSQLGRCQIVSRQQGISAGLVTLPWLIEEMNLNIHANSDLNDGDPVSPGAVVATIEGSARDILSSERIMLNTLCRLFGIASHTHRFVNEVSGHQARIYDTRKTTPGWRRLEKYAVRCGGGTNHRTGLFDAFLVKDNHLALAGQGGPMPAGQAAAQVRRWSNSTIDGRPTPAIVEVEVDSLDQLRQVLSESPDIILVDNFSLEQLQQAVAMRNDINPAVQLEASGNVNLDTVGQIAATGVERISSGALTHASRWLDLGLDWLER